MKIAVRINDSNQFSPDDWESIVHIKEINKNTTIQELLDWQKELYPKNPFIQDEKAFRQMYIAKME